MIAVEAGGAGGDATADVGARLLAPAPAALGAGAVGAGVAAGEESRFNTDRSAVDDGASSETSTISAS
jgi:hypothetical protein